VKKKKIDKWIQKAKENRLDRSEIRNQARDVFARKHFLEHLNMENVAIENQITRTILYGCKFHLISLMSEMAFYRRCKYKS